MTKKERLSPIAIYGGTFDPIHFGHLRPTLEICQYLKLNQVRFIPSYIPPHRQAPNSSVNDRLLMLEQAIHSEPRFVLDNREILRQGHSYTIDTLLSLKKEFPQHPLYLILGLDAFIHINTWHKWEQLLWYCHLIISRRPETHHDQISSWPISIQELYQNNKVDNPQQLSTKLAGYIYFMEVTQLPISSSQIRDYIKNNQSIRYLLPDEVCAIIKSKQLYSI
ncbi:MAG: nicotinate-nucleotide adenylyltransferase [Pseudomonadota bacterium]